MTHANTFKPGQLVYDLAQLQPVIVVDAEVGTFGEQDAAMREMISNSPGNRAVGYTEDTPCVDVVFQQLDSKNTKEYRYPATRLGIPQIELGQEGFDTVQFVQHKLLLELFKAVVFESEPEQYKNLLELCRTIHVDSVVLSAVLSEVRSLASDSFLDEL